MHNEARTQKIEMKAFSASGQVEGETGQIVLNGTADAQVYASLHSFLGAMHNELLARRARKVTVDLRPLKFMNSSCFKAFVSWINTAQSLDASHRYGIVFQPATEHHWQTRSLEALRNFAPGVVSIEG